jgi:hypothetical protein
VDKISDVLEPAAGVVNILKPLRVLVRRKKTSQRGEVLFKIHSAGIVKERVGSSRGGKPDLLRQRLDDMPLRPSHKVFNLPIIMSAIHSRRRLKAQPEAKPEMSSQPNAITLSTESRTCLQTDGPEYCERPPHEMNMFPSVGMRLSTSDSAEWATGKFVEPRF